MDLFSWQLDASDMTSLGAMTNPYRRGVADGASMMCSDASTGYMARCLYLDMEQM
jgi:hypothetical protein